MKDSIILGTGNSRYLKSVEDFKSLYPTYDDFVAALVSGTLPVDFNGINPAGFQQVGNPLGKAALLKDATAALYGLPNTAVPDDAFAFLGRLNQYCWKRRSKTVVYEASIGTAKNVALTTGYNASRTIEYSSSYSVGEDGTVTLNKPSVTAAIGYAKEVSNATPLKGNYFFDCYYDSNHSLTKGLFYVAPDAANARAAQDFNGTSDLYAVTMYVSKVTLTPNVSLGEWEYIFSNDRNAYPDSGIVDGTEYVFLGKPLENAISAGSGGTGTGAVSSVNGKTGDVVLTSDDVSAIPSPATATVGQIVRVKAVDDAGKPTEWEAFDGVQDVIVCGNSIVDAGVASIPRASSSEYGVIKPITVYGVEVNNNGALMATARTAANYDSFPSAGFISKGTLENINNRLVKSAMCDGTGAAWTDAERIAALLRMGCTVDDNGFVKWTAQEATQ